MFTTVCVCNCIGLALMIMLLVVNREHFNKDKKIKNLLYMIIIDMTSCVADILAFAFDGKPGIAATVIIYITNSWLFFAVILVAYCFLQLECDYMGVEISRQAKILINVIDSIGLILLVVNIFCPLIFHLEDNVYQRDAFYWVFIFIGTINTIIAVTVYAASIKQGKKLISFDVGVFVFPLVAGMAIQSLFYGVSVIWVGVAISITSVADSLKNSLLYIDPLTRSFNLYYLRNMVNYMESKNSGSFFGILLDINDFKNINDQYGHTAGDRALISAARLFMDAAGDQGTVVRYGGDEFLILVDTDDRNQMAEIAGKIEAGCKSITENNEYGYTFSVSMGWEEFDKQFQTFDGFIKLLDYLMYLKKEEYHRLHSSQELLNSRLGSASGPLNVLLSANTGLWAIESDEGKAPRMYADESMLKLLGLEKQVSPEETYHAWYDNIDKDAYAIVDDTVAQIRSGKNAEVQYPWHSPNGKTMIIRCGGVRNWDYKAGVRIEGTHQDVTGIIHYDK